jgi:GNAT superfamily N-acetyltransferase
MDSNNNFEIIKADLSHEAAVLALLDEFRTFVSEIVDGEKKVSTTAVDNGAEMFKQIVADPNSAVFVAEVGEELVGVVTIHKIPVMRRGYYRGEIEEIFVRPEQQGTGVATALMKAVLDWSRENYIRAINLESHEKLERAHHFYAKVGFTHYGKAFIYRFE